MKDIEQFLRDNKPETPDEGQFLIEMNARLNQVEGIKKTVDGENRRWRKALIIALAAGLVLGCLLTLLVLFFPVDTLQADSTAFLKALDSLQQGKEILFGAVASLAIALGLVFLFLPSRRQTI
ncbi:MAG: OST5 family protein [Bacteroidales bacterium]|nr:OST5 family protein [Bacteroidales bacterium]